MCWGQILLQMDIKGHEYGAIKAFAAPVVLEVYLVTLKTTKLC